MADERTDGPTTSTTDYTDIYADHLMLRHDRCSRCGEQSWSEAEAEAPEEEKEEETLPPHPPHPTRNADM